MSTEQPLPGAVEEGLLPTQETLVDLTEVSLLEGKRFAPRAVAYVIDLAILYALNFGMSFVLPLVLGQQYAVRAITQAATWKEHPFQLLGILVSLLGSILYFALFEWLHGATPGKMLLRMRVARIPGDRCGLGSALVRGVLRLLDGFLFGLVAAGNMTPPLQQRVGDKVAKTFVTSSGAPTLRFRRGLGWAAVALGIFLPCQAALSLAHVEISAATRPLGDRLAEQAILAHAQGNHARSAELYQQAIDAGIPKDRLAAHYFLMGNEYQHEGQMEKAIDAHRRSVEIDPNFAAGWLGLGVDYGRLGDLDRAVEYTQRSLDLAPDLSAPYFNMGVFLAQSGEPARALIFLDQALEIDATLAMAHAWKVRAYTDLGRYEEANDALAKARKLGYPDWEGLQEWIQEQQQAQPGGP